MEGERGMTEEQYMKTFIYRHNELLVSFWDFVYSLFSGQNFICRLALHNRTEAIKKAEQDYKDYVEG